MQFERFINLTLTEKSEAEQLGSFTRDGVQFAYWRAGADDEPWFKADDAGAITSFPAIHGGPTVATGAQSAVEETVDPYADLPPALAEVRRRMDAAGSEEEAGEIYDAWLFGDSLNV